MVDRQDFPLTVVGWVVVVGVIVILAGVVMWWAIASHSADCQRRERVVLSIIQNDPNDSKGALDLYTESCP